MIGKPPKIVIPGMNRGAGIPDGVVLGRRRGTKQGPVELLDLKHLTALGLATTAENTKAQSGTASTAQSSTDSLSASVSTSLSQISSSLSSNVSAVTSLSTAVSSVDSGQSVSLSQVSSSLSGAISSTTSLSSAVSTVISGSISTVNSRIDSLSAAGGAGGATTFLALTDTPAAYTGAAGKVVTVNAGETGLEFDAPAGGTGQSTSLSQISSSLSGAISSISSLSSAVSTVDSNQSTSLSQISSSLSGAISSTSSLSTAVSTVISGSISTVTSMVNSLSTAIGGGGGGWTELLYYDFGTGAASTKECDVTGYKEIVCVGYQLVHASSVQRAIQFSVDGGSTWFTTSGNYQDIAVAGTGTNNTAIFTHGTATTSARDFAVHVLDNTARIPVPVQCYDRSVLQWFKGSATAINRLRLMGSVSGSGTPDAGNFTSGTFQVLAR